VEKLINKTGGFDNCDFKLIERARTVLVVSLSKQPPGELVRIIMDWIDDADLYEFCHRYLDDGDLRLIQRD
jgi:predicted ATPase